MKIREALEDEAGTGESDNIESSKEQTGGASGQELVEEGEADEEEPSAAHPQLLLVQQTASVESWHTCGCGTLGRR